jgi:predicted nucleic acid-binding protein
MGIDASTLVFFDASCLITAAASPSGGAGYVWSLCERGFLRAAVSQAVLTETRTNLSRKFPPSALDMHDLQQSRVPLVIAAVPLGDSAPRRYPMINQKDEHVLIAALVVRADFVLTYDQPLAVELNATNLSIRAYAPGEFIKAVLPSHPASADFR